MGKSVDRKQVDDYKLSLVRFRDVVKNHTGEVFYIKYNDIYINIDYI